MTGSLLYMRDGVGESGEEVGNGLARIIPEVFCTVLDLPYHRVRVACAYEDVLALCEVTAVGMIVGNVKHLVDYAVYVCIVFVAFKLKFVFF